MARKVFAVMLLGLLACAALASAEEPKPDYRDNKPRKDPKEPKEPRNKPVLVRAPKMLQATEVTLEVADAKFSNEGTSVGSTGVLTMNLKSDGKVVGAAVLTGEAFDFDSDGSFSLNSGMTIRGVGEKLEGTLLTAQGVISWDNTAKKIRVGADTLVITGGSGLTAGADGTITLAGGADTAVPRTLAIKLTVPKAHTHNEDEAN